MQPWASPEQTAPTARSSVRWGAGARSRAADPTPDPTTVAAPIRPPSSAPASPAAAATGPQATDDTPVRRIPPSTGLLAEDLAAVRPPEARPEHRTQPRRLAAAAASALLPGLGQLVNGRLRTALLLLIPAVVLVAGVAIVVRQTPPMELLATIVNPAVLRTLINASLVLLVVRLAVVLHAFFDRRYRLRPTLAEAAVLALVIGAVALPHAVGTWYARSAEGAFGQFFGGGLVAANGSTAAPTADAVAAGVPGPDERLNVLVVGVDTRGAHSATLTDTMMLASVDRTLGTMTLISIPRDLVGVPLGNGDTYAPKLNSLYGYASRHPDAFPAGPMRAVEDAVGALLRIRVHYYAMADFRGFIRLIDEAGGVDVHLDKPLVDPTYDGKWLGRKGLRIAAGDQHLDGALALAYVRTRKSDSDFARQHRQQEVLLSLRRKLVDGGSVFQRLPALLQILGDSMRTDLPPSMLPTLAALLDSRRDAAITNLVIEHPLVKGANRAPYGSVQVPRLKQIRAMAAALLPPPGTPPSAWPPKATETASRP